MPQLTRNGCLARRERLHDLLVRLRLDAAVLTDVRDIYYFTGVLLPADLLTAFIFRDPNDASLVAPAEQGVQLEFGKVTEYQWNLRGTRDPDVAARAAKAFEGAASQRSLGAVAVQGDSIAWRMLEVVQRNASRGVTPIDDELRDLQSRKDADEVELLRASIHANRGAYEAVRNVIRPGVTELEVLSAGRRGATLAAQEKVFHDGDYQCGQFNGPARNRPVEAGELYIVDAWTCYRGYWSDLSQTFYVGSGPSDVQVALFQHIRQVQSHIPELLKPGVDGREVYAGLDEMLRQHPPLADEGLVHHGGHAIGLRIHEMPDLNPSRGGILEPGHVVCVEPGGYFPAARFGVRLEKMYLVTETGCEDLCPGDYVLHECH